MKKKILLSLAALALLLSVGCGKAEEDSAQFPTAVKIAEGESEGGQDGAPGNAAAENPSGAGNPQGNPSEGGQQRLDGLGDSQSLAGQKGAQGGFQFSDLSDRVFYFSSGAGAWWTELRIQGDGSFEGHYQDADMGDSGDDYPNGTLYYCDFIGFFDQLEKVDDFTYKMNLSSISFKEKPAQEEEIIDGVRYIYTGAYGLDGEEFYLYLPGSKLADLPQAYRDWVGYHNLEAVQEEELSFYGLYNADGELGFSSSVYEEQSLSERIAMEISFAEELEMDRDSRIQNADTQQEMNQIAAEGYQKWDETLNIVWKLLEANLSEEEMEALRIEEREWIASKDAEVRAAGLENEGGSLQPLLEATKAEELTKARVYELAKYAEGR